MNTRIFILAHAPLAHALRECALHVLADGPGAWQTRTSTFAAQFAWPTLGKKILEALSVKSTL